MFSGEKTAFDLTNPKNVWNINKLCENKSEYLEYHAKVAEAFKQDCENLLLAYAAREDLTFKIFAEVWQKLSFSLVFVGQEFFDELPVFAESCFFIIKKYIVFSEDIYIRVGAFYLLYGIYAKQLSKEAVPIRMTSEEYSSLCELEEHMYHSRKAEDFTYIFRYLKFNQAFQFVATTRCLALESKFTWQEKKMKNNIFTHIAEKISDPVSKMEEILYSQDIYSLPNLGTICEEYDKALKEFAASAPDSSLAQNLNQESNIAEEIEGLFEELQNDLDETPAESECRTVAEIKQEIKNRAFTTLVSDKRNIE